MTSKFPSDAIAERKHRYDDSPMTGPSERPSTNALSGASRPHQDRVNDANARVAQFDRGRVPKDVRVAQVVAVARQLFAERGVASTSMEDIAEQADISKPIIYNLLGSKESLFDAVVDDIATDLRIAIEEAIADQGTPRAHLGAAVARFCRFVGAHHVQSDMIVKAGPSNGRAAGKDQNYQAEAVARSVRQTLATDHAGLGEAQLDELALAIAFAINGATEGLARWWREHRDWTPDDLGALIASIFFRDAAT